MVLGEGCLDMFESARELERDEQLLASMGRSQTEEGTGPQLGRKWIKGGAWKTGHPVSRTIEADTSDRRDNAIDHS